MKLKNLFTVKSMAISSAIAAIYVILTLINPFSFGQIQCRVSEALTALPLIIPQSIPGLFIGCLISNLIGSASMLDIVFGSLATLLAAITTYILRKNKYVALLAPVVFNGIIVGLVLHFTINVPLLETMFFVALGEAIAVYILGLPLLKALEKVDIVSKLK
ncbi:MAG: QueT transporter family protein [Christensenellaceae bacterium]|nr:QueT transporter family protein [Christensenellaceae bacterium]